MTFTGTAPFNFTYAINGVPQAPVSTSSNPYIINATLAGTYTIVNITDNKLYKYRLGNHNNYLFPETDRNN